MIWFYLVLGYLVLAATLSALTRSVQKGAKRAGLVVFGAGLLFNLLNPSGLDLRLALTFAAGLACFGGWALVASLLSYDDTLQEHWDAAQAEAAQKREAESGEDAGDVPERGA